MHVMSSQDLTEQWEAQWEKKWETKWEKKWETKWETKWGTNQVTAKSSRDRIQFLKAQKNPNRLAVWGKKDEFGPLFHVQMSKKCAPVWPEAHLEVKRIKKTAGFEPFLTLRCRKKVRTN